VGEETGVPTGGLVRLTAVLNGGVGFSGGICGALAGAVMAVNSIFGMEVRNSSLPRNVRDFIVGHLNLILKRPMGMPEPFGLGREIVSRFRIEAGSIDCSEIVGRSFKDIAEFDDFYSKSDRCRKLIDFASNITCRVIERWSLKENP
jgi:C_GCAxxG_C_C family probable redox protein